MDWSETLRALGRGIGLAKRVIKGRLKASPSIAEPAPVQGSRLVRFDGFGDNPGRLRMLAHLPPVTAGRPLVVLLHGCGQDVAAFAVNTGWTEMADRLNFPLILPEQTDSNNAGRCFQWFQPADTARDAGEAGSIASMTRAAIARFESDATRIFIVGLSAGGAMAAAMLAAYPDLFAAGGVVAGLPVGSARSGLQAMRRMAAAGPELPPAQWAAKVRDAAPPGYDGPWPRLSVWHGQMDKTVIPENAILLTTQWHALLGLDARAAAEQVLRGVHRRMWPGGARPRLELWTLPALSHAYPIGSRLAVPGQFVAEAPVDATEGIARFFGLD